MEQELLSDREEGDGEMSVVSALSEVSAVSAVSVGRNKNN